MQLGRGDKMIKVWVLSAILGNGFGMMPMVSENACYILMQNLHSIVTKPSCDEIELFVEGSKPAPEMAPMPKKKPKGKVA